MARRARVSDDATRAQLEALETGPLHAFRDWPIAVPSTAGVYSVWRGAELVYVGMAGRGRSADELAAHAATRKVGLADRLTSHASGRRSGDQFAVYVCDRLVLVTLSAEQIRAVADGALSLDTLTRDYVRTHLAFRFASTPDGARATCHNAEGRRSHALEATSRGRGKGNVAEPAPMRSARVTNAPPGAAASPRNPREARRRWP